MDCAMPVPDYETLMLPVLRLFGEGVPNVARLATLSPQRFERLILDLLSAMGYGGGDLSNARMTPTTGDGGIDGIIHEDALGLDAVYVQAKRYAPGNSVGRAPRSSSSSAR
jgi:restriction endonuclease Mrr